MANYDFVIPYDARMEAWLEERGWPHPKARSSNRLPTRQETIDAIAATGVFDAEVSDDAHVFVVRKDEQRSGAYETRIEFSNREPLADSPPALTMHGSFEAELLLLELLAHSCGQLILCPDTGSPAVVVEPGMNTGEVFRLWRDAVQQQDPWAHFYRNLGY